jgi:hypothetical protein
MTDSGGWSADADRSPFRVTYEVPGDRPVHRCKRCDTPFATAEDRALHRGLAHEGTLTADERAAFAAAREREERALRRFRLQALGAVIVLYFLLLTVYALV